MTRNFLEFINWFIGAFWHIFFKEIKHYFENEARLYNIWNQFMSFPNMSTFILTYVIKSKGCKIEIGKRSENFKKDNPSIPKENKFIV